MKKKTKHKPKSSKPLKSSLKLSDIAASIELLRNEVQTLKSLIQTEIELRKHTAVPYLPPPYLPALPKYWDPTSITSWNSPLLPKLSIPGDIFYESAPKPKD